jgi:hypothetical protein
MEKAMRLTSCLLSCLFLALAGILSCAHPLPPATPGVAWQPGRYVKESYISPDFKPESVTYVLAAFPLEEVKGVNPDEFLKIFREEFTRAWQASGLKIGPGENAATLTGTIPHLTVRGAGIRLITGRLQAALTISGTITRGEQILFAFRDRVAVSSPLAPGPGAPKEMELLLRQLARETAHHLLNELLLQGFTADSG